MVLRQEVIYAFSVLGIPSDAEEAFACRAYKKLALLHHPDRNHGDATSTARFQEIGAAWNICQRHYDDPAWSQVPSTNARWSGPERFNERHFPAYDDIPLDPEEEAAFYEFMMFEIFMGRFTHKTGQRFRFQRRGGFSGGVYTFSQSFAKSQSNQAANTARQTKESEQYEKRKRDFEREIEAEKREVERAERAKQAAADRHTSAQAKAFQFGRLGNSTAVRNAIEEFNLDINASERVLNPKRQQPTSYETLLHVAASYCDESLVQYLLDKGANPTAVNKANLMPFHVSIMSRNEPVVRFFLARSRKPYDGWHPSKAAPDGRTPLDLAIASGSLSLVRLMVKDATVHNVRRCWEQSPSYEIKDILVTKKGFTPYLSTDNDRITSEKGLRKLREARKETLRKEEKAKRALEQHERRADQIRRVGHCAAEERLKAEVHLSDTEEKEQDTLRQRGEVGRHREELEARWKEGEGDEAYHREGNTASQRERRQTRWRVEKEGRFNLEAEPSRGVEHEARQQHLVGRILCAETEGGERQVRETAIPSEEMEDSGAEELQELVSSPGRRGQFKPTAVRRAQGTNTQDQERELEAMQNTEHAGDFVLKEGSTMHDAMMRRRAEQSSRDKARHQRMKESSRLNGGLPGPVVGALSSTTAVANNHLPSALHWWDSSDPIAESPSIWPTEDIQTCAIPDYLFI